MDQKHRKNIGLRTPVFTFFAEYMPATRKNEISIRSASGLVETGIAMNPIHFAHNTRTN